MNRDLCTRDVLLDPRRIEFYKNHMSLGEFHKKYNEMFPTSSTVIFKDKFKELSEIIPELEVWTVMVILDPKGDLCYSYRDSISTSGRIWGHVRNKPKCGSLDKDGYLMGIFSGMYSSIHRAVLSSFCMDIPTELDKFILTGNHIDKNKINNHIDNLEWMEMIDNVKDGNQYKSKPVRIEVVKEKIGIPVGSVFYLPSRNWLANHGINVIKFKERTRPGKLPFGLKVTSVEKDQFIETEIPQAFIDLLKIKIGV